MRTAVLLLILSSFFMNSHAQDLKTVTYSDGDQKLNGLISSNAGSKLPAVLILPAWKGIDNEAKNAALELEKHGYVAFIADIYGEGNIPADNTSAAKIAGYYKSNYETYQQRIAAALDQLKKSAPASAKIAVIGYCFGGTGALETARAGLPVEGVVCIHGGLGKAPERKNGPIRTKILVEHPADDKSVSDDDYDNLIAEMNEAAADWQIVTYAHSKHTFTNPESPDYNPVMAHRAWQHTLLFLDEILK